MLCNMHGNCLLFSCIIHGPYDKREQYSTIYNMTDMITYEAQTLKHIRMCLFNSHTCYHSVTSKPLI